MGRDQRPSFTRHGMMRAGAALAVSFALLAGCGGHANVQVNSVGASAGGVSGGTTVNVQGRTSLGTLLTVILLAGVSYESDRAMSRSGQVPYEAYVPELDPTRRIAVQDCTRPIEDWSANLKCR